MCASGVVERDIYDLGTEWAAVQGDGVSWQRLLRFYCNWTRGAGGQRYQQCTGCAPQQLFRQSDTMPLPRAQADDENVNVLHPDC